jgi:D-proline reductase (dithiol) PrdB
MRPEFSGPTDGLPTHISEVIMPVDSFLYLPRLIARYYRLSRIDAQLPIPWTPLSRALGECRLGLVTSGGLYHPGHEEPFDMERERREPAWGDPTYRTLPADMDPSAVGMAHHHIYERDVRADMNILLPITRCRELAREGCIGSVADHAYSFMGYQGFPADLAAWRQVYGPQVAQKFIGDDVDCVLLTTA